MTRRLTILAVLIVAAVSIGLYEIEARVREVSRDLASLNAELVREQQAIRVLRAEWSYLSQPSRLQALAKHYLPLQPLAAHQYGRLTELPMRPPTLADGDLGIGRGPVMRGGIPIPGWKPHRRAGVLVATHEVDNG